VDDDGLRELARAPRLGILNLVNTSVSDLGLAHLARCRTLRILRVQESKVTQAGAERLAAALPNSYIEFPGGGIDWWSPEGLSQRLPASAAAPTRDAVPGEVVAYETFDKPTADWPPAKLPAGVQATVADGLLRTEFPNRNYDFGYTFGTPAPDVA